MFKLTDDGGGLRTTINCFKLRRTCNGFFDNNFTHLLRANTVSSSGAVVIIPVG